LRVLFLAHRIPYPPNKGDKIRSFNEVKYLSKNHEIDLACLADEPDDLKYRTDLRAYCRKVSVVPLDKTAGKIKGFLHLLAGGSISAGYFYKKNLQSVIDRWLAKTTYDAILCFSSPMAEYVFRSKLYTMTQSSVLNIQQGSFPILIMDFCDLDSDKWCQYAVRSGFPLNMLYRLEAKRLLAYEKKVNQAFDHSIFVSRKEADLFKQAYPQARNLTVIPNGVDHDYFAPEGPGGRSLKAEVRSSQSSVFSPQSSDSFPTLLFTGAMDYHANVDGVVWFCDHIFPKIKKRYPDARFVIVGSNPRPSVKALEKIDGILVTGFVDDIRPYCQTADICVIPLRLACGVQNKVLEALAMAKPVVTTSAAVQGISAQDGAHLMVSDDAVRFAESVNFLSEQEDRREQFGRAGRRFVEEHYDWGANMIKMVKVLTVPSAGG